MGTVYIERDEIVRLSSPEQFVVELSNGRRARGSPGKSEAERQLVVQYRERQRVLDMQEVVVPAKRAERRTSRPFWSRTTSISSMTRQRPRSTRRSPFFPASAMEGETTDYGIVTSLGYSF
jgi:hypothetical protein